MGNCRTILLFVVAEAPYHNNYASCSYKMEILVCMGTQNYVARATDWYEIDGMVDAGITMVSQ